MGRSSGIICPDLTQSQNPYKRDAGRAGTGEKVIVKTEAEIGDMCFIDGGRGHKPRNAALPTP